MSIDELISHKPVKIFSEDDIIAKTLNTFVDAIIYSLLIMSICSLKQLLHIYYIPLGCLGVHNDQHYPILIVATARVVIE